MAPARKSAATPSRLVSPLLRLLERRGVDPEPVMRRFGLCAESRAAVEVPIAALDLGLLLESAAELLDEPHLGLLLPEWLEYPDYALPELAARASPTLRESLERMVRYAPLFSAELVFELHEEGAHARFTHRILGHARGAGRHLHEFAMAAMLHHARTRVGSAFSVQEVHFIHSRPPSLERLRAHFDRATLRFGQLHNAVVFDAAWLCAPQQTADARLLSTADSLAQAALSQTSAVSSGLSERVRAQLQARLPRGDARVRPLARELGLSVRTLQRRLDEEGLSFAELLDGVRSDVARALVGSGELPLTDIALRLGFSEFATFSRAFKRWYGVSPGAYRTAQRST